MPVCEAAGSDTAEHPASIQQSIVLVLDESCHGRQFTKSNLQNGIPQAHVAIDKLEGLLSNEDIEMLLAMFDKGEKH
jgi:hypothetical protein